MRKIGYRFSLTATAALTALVMAAGFSACDTRGADGNDLGKLSSTSAGTGTVTVSISVKGLELPPANQRVARTVYPAEVEPGYFDRYVLSFVQMSGGAVHDPVCITSGTASDPITLTVGTYTITATAVKGTEEIASGSATVTVTTGDNEAVAIILGPKTGAGNGTFSYNITIPSGATGTLTIKQGANTIDEAVTLTAGTATSGTRDLTSGTYLVHVATTKYGKNAGLTESLHIYKGLTSTLAETYTDEEFEVPQTVTALNLTSFFPAPVKDATPVRSFGTGTGEYTGAIEWQSLDGTVLAGNAFAASTAYTAVVTLTANPGYTFSGVAVDAFTHTNATTPANDAGSGGEITATFVFPAAVAATESLSVTAGFNYGQIAVTGEGGTIYQSGTPSSLILSVEGYEDHAWYIDESQNDPLTRNPVIINAADYAVGEYTVVLVGSKSGQQYSQSVDFTVATEVPKPELTGTVIVTGTLMVGQTASANISDLTYSSAGTLSYAWASGDTAEGATTPIAGTTGASLVLDASLVGKYVAVTVTSSGNSGYVTGVSSSVVVRSQIEITVSDASDDAGADSTEGTLRYALTNAQAGDTIFVEVAGPIELTSVLPQITKSITIKGNGVTLTKGAGYPVASKDSSLLYINSTSAVVNISGVHFTGGDGTQGGAIKNTGTLTLESCIFSNNRPSSTSTGGAIHTVGDTAIRGCTFYNNTATTGSAAYINEKTLTLMGNVFYTDSTKARLVSVASKGTIFTSCNVVDRAFGTVGATSGWVAGTGDKTLTDMGISGSPVDAASFAPVSGLADFLSSAPDGFPATYFSGAPRTYPGAPGAVAAE